MKKSLLESSRFQDWKSYETFNIEGSVLGWINENIPSKGVSRAQLDEISLFARSEAWLSLAPRGKQAGVENDPAPAGHSDLRATGS